MITVSKFFKSSRDPFFLFVFCFFIFVGNGIFIYSSDDMIPTSVLPFSILRHFDFEVGRYITNAGQAIPYYIKQSLHGLVSTSPIGSAITISPFYFPYILFGGEASVQIGAVFGKISSAIIASISASLFYILLKELSISRINRIIFTLLFAIGSETFAISSQSLWQHGPAVFWFILFMIMIVNLKNQKSPKTSAFFIGISSGMLLLTRPADIILIIPFLLTLLKKDHRKYIVTIACGFLPIFIFNISYNFYYFGNYSSSGYGTTNSIINYFSFPVYEGLLGNLFSPSKGLFIFMPWSIISFFWLKNVTSKQFYKTIYAPAFVSIFPYIFLYANFFQWPGGNSYGPRYMTDLIPVLALLSAGYVEHHLSKLKTKLVKFISYSLIILMLIWSTTLQFLGAYVQFNNNWYSAAWPNSFTEPLWSFKNSQFMYHFNSLKAAYNPPQQLKSPKVEFLSIDLLDKPYLYKEAIRPTIFDKNRVYVGKATIKNIGTETWSAFPMINGANVVHFVFTAWDGETKIIEGFRSTLFHSVQPGETITVYFSFQTPDKPGTYDYIFTLIQEGVTWFQSKNEHDNAAKITINIK